MKYIMQMLIKCLSFFEKLFLLKTVGVRVSSVPSYVGWGVAVI